MQRLKLVRNLYSLFFKISVLVLLVLLSACSGSAIKSSTQYNIKGEASLSVRDSFNEALALMNDNNYEDAAALLEKINAQNNRLAGVHANLGIAYGKLNQYGKAKSALETAVGLNPNSPEILNEMAIAYRNSGEYIASKEVYQKILKKYPKSGQSHLNLGILCDIYMNDIDCALKHYKEYEALYANVPGESKDKKRAASASKSTKNDKVVHWINDLEKRK